MLTEHLSDSHQNYLKMVWKLQEWSGEPVSASQLAEALGLRRSTVSDAVKKLTTQGYFLHSPYGGVVLTDLGQRAALEMVRRHRLIEMFLVEVMGYSWQQVHDEAERLEHAVSDFMIHRMDELLGYPRRDPHGDPIPDAEGNVAMPQVVRFDSLITEAAGGCLGDLVSGDGGGVPGLQVGTVRFAVSPVEGGVVVPVMVERVSDAIPDLLDLFGRFGVSCDTPLWVKVTSGQGSACVVSASADLVNDFVLTRDLLCGVWVSPT